MNTLTRLSFRFSWINLSAVTLIALLQRTPVLRCLVAADELVVVSRAGAVLKSAFAVATTLGAYDTLAGATVLAPSQPSPLNAAAGKAISPVGFTVTNTINIGSWAITGDLPPGLTLMAVEGGNTLTGPGTLDATTPGMDDGYGGTSSGNARTTPVLSGTPTSPGTYTFSLRAYELGGARGLASLTFPYTIVVTGAEVTTAPSITTQPQGRSVAAGASVAFTAAASGTPAPTYQWRFNGTPIAGATAATYTLASAQSANAGSYTVVATNSAGTATSSAAVLTVTVASAAPAFTTQPISATVVSGSTVAFNAVASGAASYQWARNGTALAGATNSTLLLNGVTAANTGNYTCTATNGSGSATSSTAALALTTTTDIGRLSNLSTRALVGTGSNILVVGFVLGGAGTSGAKPMLVRGTGPTLTSFGVPGALGDPMLSFYQGSALIAADDNWGGNAQVIAADAAVGAFELPDTRSLDSALYLPNLGANVYSAQIAGKGDGTGVALAEVYDATPTGAFTPTTPRLINLSARVQVGTGSNILVAGFVIGGSTAKTLLLRASGPAIALFGVTGTLPDPLLRLYDAGGNVIASNNGWAGNPQIVATAAAIGAFDWTSPTSNDSALLITLPPGAYSAQVSGASGDTGVALVEVYEVP
ncbi:MAG: immunoglobulin domain-containing protein [Opitutae bacterium]|nr:immunoglobulin domain-containing protein [Opitutae bacterium]